MGEVGGGTGQMRRERKCQGRKDKREKEGEE